MTGYYIPLSADIFPETVNRIAINEAAFIADFCPPVESCVNEATASPVIK